MKSIFKRCGVTPWLEHTNLTPLKFFQVDKVVIPCFHMLYILFSFKQKLIQPYVSCVGKIMSMWTLKTTFTILKIIRYRIKKLMSSFTVGGHRNTESRDFFQIQEKVVGRVPTVRAFMTSVYVSELVQSDRPNLRRTQSEETPSTAACHSR